MEINKLIANNLNEISCHIDNNVSIGIAGLSGSGKSTFCSTIANESIKRIATLLPKSEYRFLFGERLTSNYSAEFIANLPLVFYLGKNSSASNPRSTLGTHTGIFRDIREKFAASFNATTEFFSFNSSIMWCTSCKGRGSTAGKTCKVCNGTRYNNEIQKYCIVLNNQSYDIARINSMNAYELYDLANNLGISNVKRNILKNLIELNVGYISIDRVMSSLSGGETVRVLLAEFMAQCRNSLIIIDEISIGLDHDTLVNVLDKISTLGSNNQIWLIDHSDIALNASEKLIFFGPGSGKDGGNIVKNSPRPLPVYRTSNISAVKAFYTFKKLQKRIIDVDELAIPKNRLITITGESGCGKTTLVNDCIIPYFQKNYKDAICVVIGQDRNQSITSKSTVASFLNVSKYLNKYSQDILSLNLSDVLDVIKKDKYIKPKVDMLLQLGLGYLSFSRKVQTLSTGEFQCLHLVSKLTENFDHEMVLILDEPSKGLSQNILNLLMKMISKILEDETKTILVIEHNDYFLSCSDFVIDFGKRTGKPVKSLRAVYQKDWIHHLDSKLIAPKLTSRIDIDNHTGIIHITDDVDELFSKYENQFKGGVLKHFSPIAQWVYKDYRTDKIIPIVALDLEGTLYSKNTFLFEVAGIINAIIKKASPSDTDLFDLYSKENLCECCKGTGKLNTIDMDVVINDANNGFWNELLRNEVMIALKDYNYSKIKFLFKEIKNETGFDLNKSFINMSDEEKKVFLYGYWDKSFYDVKKKTQRKWKGIIHLIIKYMRSSNSPLKKAINESMVEIPCPMCKGSILKHKQELQIGNFEIRKLITSRIREAKSTLMDIDRVQRIVDILGDDVNLNMDVSTLQLEKQVLLKLLDIEFANLSGFQIVLKNASPFLSFIAESLKRIATQNKVILLDYPEVTITKKAFLEQAFAKGKLKSSSYVYEALGFSKVNTEINKIRKNNPCCYCKGRRVLREESIFDGVDITETPCNACGRTGINKNGLELKVDGVSVGTWLNGGLGSLQPDVPANMQNISLMSKIGDLNKSQLYFLKKFKENNEC